MLDVPHQYIIHSYFHQQALAHLLRKIGNYLALKKTFEWEVLPFIKIDESATSPVPDILICCDMDIKAFIEITEPAAFDFECKKAANIVETYEIEEGFFFDRKRTIWRKYKLGIGEITENASFCDSIGYDLNEFLK